MSSKEGSGKGAGASGNATRGQVAKSATRPKAAKAAKAVKAAKAPKAGKATGAAPRAASTKTVKPNTQPAAARRARTPPTRPKRGPSRGRQSRRWRSLLWPTVKWGLVGAIWGIIALTGVVAFYAYDLPDIQAAAARQRPAGITVLATDGGPLAVAGEVYGDPVSVATLPPALVAAVLATEDRRFREHWGVDPLGIARAMVVNVLEGRVVQGGSTITQQVAKTLFLTNDRTIRRKVQELLLSIWLEASFSKDQILGLYLNRVYLGAGIYGMDAAARRYFRRPATDLTIYQAAVLAGLMKAPSRLNPASSPERAHARALEVLGNLVETGDLSAAEAQRIAAEGQPSLALARGAGAGGRYFADWVLDRLGGYVGVFDRDVVVETTLDPAAQVAAEAALAAVLDDPTIRAKGATQGAVVVMDTQGAVLAMVGGRSWGESPFNRAVQARRQPGSAFKPVVWLAGLEAGLEPGSLIDDAPVTVRGWSPKNYDGRYRGPVSMAEGLALSLNTVAVRIAEHAGRARVAQVARRLGLTEVDSNDPSMALGTIEVSLLDMTAAYAPFVNGGHAAFPHGVVRVTEPDGTMIYARRGTGETPRVLSPAHAQAMRSMLRRVVSGGTGRKAQPDAARGLTAYGKTGTTQASRDAWFVGFVEDPSGRTAVAGVWIGDDAGRPMNGLGGGGPAATVFRHVFERWRP